MHMKKILLFFVCSFFLVFAGDKNFGSIVVDKVVKVYDGDTFMVNIKGYPPIIGDSIYVRIYGVDTPEKKGGDPYTRDLAQKARLFTEKKLNKAKVITLKNMRRDKYFRICADVYVDRENLAKELIRVGLGKEYFGGKKVRW